MHPVQRCTAGMEAPQWPPVPICLDCSTNSLLCTAYPPSEVAHRQWDTLHNHHHTCFVMIGAPHFVKCLTPHYFSASLTVSILLCWDSFSSIPVSTPQQTLALFFFILLSFNTFSVLLNFTQHSPCDAPLLVVVAPRIHSNITYCLSNTNFDLTLKIMQLHQDYISWMKPNGIGIQLYPIAKYKWSVPAINTSSLIGLLINCTDQLSSAMMGWEKLQIPLIRCLSIICPLLSWVIALVYLHLGLDQLTIFQVPQSWKGQNRILNHMTACISMIYKY